MHQEARTKNLKPNWKGMKLMVNETAYEYDRKLSLYSHIVDVLKLKPQTIQLRESALRLAGKEQTVSSHSLETQE